MFLLLLLSIWKLTAEQNPSRSQNAQNGWLFIGFITFLFLAYRAFVRFVYSFNSPCIFTLRVLSWFHFCYVFIYFFFFLFSFTFLFQCSVNSVIVFARYLSVVGFAYRLWILMLCLCLFCWAYFLFLFCFITFWLREESEKLTLPASSDKCTPYYMWICQKGSRKTPIISVKKIDYTMLVIDVCLLFMRLIAFRLFFFPVFICFSLI